MRNIHNKRLLKFRLTEHRMAHVRVRVRSVDCRIYHVRYSYSIGMKRHNDRRFVFRQIRPIRTLSYEGPPFG